jgi:septal ring factor EnvC (AmiA/AmiB activator)
MLYRRGELVAKTYGKSKIYYMNQNNLPVPDEAERQEVEASINSEEDTCVKLEKQLKALESELSGINSQISDADLDNLLTELQDEEQNLQQKLSILEKPGRKPISPGKKDTLKRKFNTYRVCISL